jgi:hypothetical protein
MIRTDNEAAAIVGDIGDENLAAHDFFILASPIVEQQLGGALTGYFDICMSEGMPNLSDSKSTEVAAAEQKRQTAAASH